MASPATANHLAGASLSPDPSHHSRTFLNSPPPTSLDSPVHYRGVGPMSSWLILLFIAITLIAVVLDLGKR